MKQFFSLAVLLALLGCGRSPLGTLKNTSNNSTPGGDHVELLGGELSESGYFIQRLWQKGPWIDEFSELVLIVTDSKGILVDLTDMQVVPYMPDPNHDHGTAPVVIERASQGIYRIKEIDLYMYGTWEIRISAKEFKKALKWQEDIK